MNRRTSLSGPVQLVRAQPLVDVTAAMNETPAPHALSLKVVAPPVPPAAHGAAAAEDPFAEVEI